MVRGINLSQIGKKWGFYGVAGRQLFIQAAERTGGRVLQVAKQPAFVQLYEDSPPHGRQAIRFVDGGIPKQFGVTLGDQYGLRRIVEHAQKIAAPTADRPGAVIAFYVQGVMPTVARNL